MPEPVETVIGFDFGKHWIGVAVGQTLTGQARPLAAIRSGDWRKIEKLLGEWRPQRIVVGLPLDLAGNRQAMTARAERFGRQLEGRFGIPSELVDERLTTREAWQLAVEREQRKSKPEIDSLAAMLITESWLHQHARN